MHFEDVGLFLKCIPILKMYLENQVHFKCIRKIKYISNAFLECIWKIKYISNAFLECIWKIKYISNAFSKCIWKIRCISNVSQLHFGQRKCIGNVFLFRMGEVRDHLQGADVIVFIANIASFMLTLRVLTPASVFCPYHDWKLWTLKKQCYWANTEAWPE